MDEEWMDDGCKVGGKNREGEEDRGIRSVMD